jgi:hypothetical protein
MIMQQHDNNQDSILKESKGKLALIVPVVHGWAMMLQAWTRAPGSCGQKYFGVQAVFGLVTACVFPLFFPSWYMERYYWFCVLTVVLFGVHRFKSTWNRRHGLQLHSYFVGIPWVWRWRPSLKRDAAIFLEGMMQFTAGILLMPVCETLGRFWLIGVFANVISQALIKERDQRRLEQLEDALIEQTHQGDEFQRYIRR